MKTSSLTFLFNYFKFDSIDFGGISAYCLYVISLVMIVNSEEADEERERSMTFEVRIGNVVCTVNIGDQAACKQPLQCI